MSQKDYDMKPRWYVVHTYSGYENKVKTDLEKTVKNRELEDYFFDIVVPMEEQIEIKDGKKTLFTPVSAEDLKDVHIGDIVYLTGDITTCRDVAHRRVVEEGREIPVDVKDAAIFHAGPIIRPLGDEKYEMVSLSLIHI